MVFVIYREEQDNEASLITTVVLDLAAVLIWYMSRKRVIGTL